MSRSYAKPEDPPADPNGRFAGLGVVVTGACGFIGSHLVETLVRDGASVRALVHYRPSSSLGLLEELPPQVLDAVEVIQGDVRDPHLLYDVVREDDIVFHLAAQVSIPYSYRAPREFFETNVLGTLNVLESVRRKGARRLVHTSSSEVYGSAQYQPMDELHPQVAQSPYAASKIGADKAAESYWRSFAAPVVTVRPFNTFGPRQSARAIIPSVLAQALTAETVHVGSLHPVRDLNFVADTVAGFLAAASTPGVEGMVFNLGSGRGVRMRELVEMILRLLGSECEVIEASERLRPAASEVDALVCDARRAASHLGWKSAVTLEEGLSRTADWAREHSSLSGTNAYHV